MSESIEVSAGTTAPVAPISSTGITSAAPSPASEPVSDVSWASSLPEDIRGEVGLSKFKDIAGLAKSYLSAEKMIAGSLRIPGEKASPEEKAAFMEKLNSIEGVVKIPDGKDKEAMAALYAKLGRPEAADKYDVKLKTGETFKDPQIAMLLGAAHGAGMNQTQVDAILGVYDNLVQKFDESAIESKAKAEELLHKQWGSKFDENMAAANMALKSYHAKFPEAVAKLMEDPHTSTNPVIASLFAELGSRMQEGSSIATSQGASFNTARADAEAKIAAVMKSGREHPYWNSSDPGHNKAKLELDDLYRIAHS